ncbi:MAG: zinc-binding dehydrogenase, partial [Burkholderiaceae bacterium]
ASSTAEFGVAALRKTGTYVAVGLYGGDLSVSVPLLVLRAITVRGSYVGNLGELRELIELVKAGRVPPLPVETLPMDSVNEALDRLRAGKVKGRLVLAR